MKRRLSERRRDELFTVFVDNVDAKASKIAFYEALANVAGDKKVLVSSMHRWAASTVSRAMENFRVVCAKA